MYTILAYTHSTSGTLTLFNAEIYYCSLLIAEILYGLALRSML